MSVKVYLVKRSVKREGKAVSYWALRWAGDNGKMVSESLGRVSEMTKSDAEDRRRQKLIDLGSGKTPRNRPPKVDLAGFCDELIESLRGDLRASTLAEYRGAADHAIAAVGGDLAISRLDWRHVGTIKTYLADGRSPATVRKCLITLRAMFYRAARRGMVTANPFARADMPAAQAKQARIFTRAEITKMVEAASGIWWQALVRLLADTGLRKMEALHLRWEDVDIEGEQLQVRSHRAGTFSVGEIQYPILAWNVKAKSSTRTVPLTPEVLALLQRLRLTAGGSAYVFLGLDRLKAVAGHLGAGKLSEKFDLVPNLLRDFQRLQGTAKALEAKARTNTVAKIEWPLGTLHDLRKSWCTHAAATVPMHVLREWAGHSDINTTARYYLRTTADDAAKLRKALAAG